MNKQLPRFFLSVAIGILSALTDFSRPAEAADPVETALESAKSVPARPAALPLPDGIVQAERFIGRGELFSAQLAYQSALTELLADTAPVPEE